MQYELACSCAALRRHFIGALALSAGLLAVGAPAPVHAQGLPDFTDLVERVGPAVVNIRTTERARSRAVGPEMDEDMLEFFRRFGIPIPNRPGPRGQQPAPDSEPQQRGLGSGFILSADGYVMTNAHVVDGADEVIVTLTDKRELKARPIGADKRSDVALLKIEASGLPFVRIGDVARLKVGEWVLAIGSPFGLDNSVTAGIVSAKSRDTGDLVPLIQTDVAINPGNSGGPLLDSAGRVVGVNTAIIAGAQGICFATSMDSARSVVTELLRHGRVRRASLGIAAQNAALPRRYVHFFNLSSDSAVRVMEVTAGGPAARAGVEQGDLLIALDGMPCRSIDHLHRLLTVQRIGVPVTVGVVRRDRKLELSLQPIELQA